MCRTRKHDFAALRLLCLRLSFRSSYCPLNLATTCTHSVSLAIATAFRPMTTIEQTFGHAIFHR